MSKASPDDASPRRRTHRLRFPSPFSLRNRFRTSSTASMSLDATALRSVGSAVLREAPGFAEGAPGNRVQIVGVNAMRVLVPGAVLRVNGGPLVHRVILRFPVLRHSSPPVRESLNR